MEKRPVLSEGLLLKSNCTQRGGQESDEKAIRCPSDATLRRFGRQVLAPHIGRGGGDTRGVKARGRAARAELTRAKSSI